MDTTTLQTFLSVAEHASFSLASEQLHLTQPAISKRIQSLEAELKTTLFDRIGRHVSLTESGQALLPRAKKILIDMEDSRRAILNLSGHTGGNLSIGTSHHIGLHHLPAILRRYHADYSEVALDMHFMDSEVACRAVVQGELELGIVTLPLSPPANLHTRVIWPDPLSIVCSKDHALARTKTLNLKQLCEHSAILPASGTYTRETFERAIADRGLILKVSMSTNYLETIKMMVSIGLGWSVLPSNLLSKELTVLKIPGLSLSRQLGVVWHQQRTLSNAASAMLETLDNQ